MQLERKQILIVQRTLCSYVMWRGSEHRRPFRSFHRPPVIAMSWQLSSPGQHPKVRTVIIFQRPAVEGWETASLALIGQRKRSRIRRADRQLEGRPSQGVSIASYHTSACHYPVITPILPRQDPLTDRQTATDGLHVQTQPTPSSRTVGRWPLI